MNLIRITIAILVFPMFLQAQDTTQYIRTDTRNSPEQEKKPYVILISADGFRYDLAEKYHTPFLLKMSRKGVRAASMRPSFPSLTFPNHYSIVTGMYPSHHGIVANTFYDPSRDEKYALWYRDEVTDPSWYGGIPLWTLAEKQGMISACFYWVGSESHILNTDPTYYFNYNEEIPIERRIKIVKEWLDKPADRRPHLITFYFPEVDHALHRFGPNSEEGKEAALFVDRSVKALYKVAQESGLPVNFIFVSDHGMMELYPDGFISMKDVIDKDKFRISYGSTIALLYAKDKKDIMPTYKRLKASAQNYDVYLPTEVPDRWHYSEEDDYYGRIGDIILVAHPKYGFKFSDHPISRGQHGYDNAYPQMHATFYAWGPVFKSGYTVGTFDNVHVYPLIAHILGLTIGHKIDGKFSVLKDILKESK